MNILLVHFFVGVGGVDLWLGLGSALGFRLGQVLWLGLGVRVRGQGEDVR